MVAKGKLEAIDSVFAWRTLFIREIQEVRDDVMTTHAIDVIRAKLIDEVDELLGRIVTSRKYGRENIEAELERIDRRISQLREVLTRTSQDPDNSELLALKGWVKHWIELKIFCLVMLQSLFRQSDSPNAVSEGDEQLLEAFALLPYSVETCLRRVTQLQHMLLKADHR